MDFCHAISHPRKLRSQVTPIPPTFTANPHPAKMARRHERTQTNFNTGGTPRRKPDQPGTAGRTGRVSGQSRRRNTMNLHSETVGLGLRSGHTRDTHVHKLQPISQGGQNYALNKPGRPPFASKSETHTIMAPGHPDATTGILRNEPPYQREKK